MRPSFHLWYKYQSWYNLRYNFSWLYFHLWIFLDMKSWFSMPSFHRWYKYQSWYNFWYNFLDCLFVFEFCLFFSLMIDMKSNYWYHHFVLATLDECYSSLFKISFHRLFLGKVFASFFCIDMAFHTRICFWMKRSILALGLFYVSAAWQLFVIPFDLLLFYDVFRVLVCILGSYTS